MSAPLLAADPPAPAITLLEPAPPDTGEPAPATAPSKAAQGNELRVGFRVDTDALGTEGQPIANRARQVAAEIYADKGYIEPLDEEDPVIVVVVERAADPENPGYVIGFSIERLVDDAYEIVGGSARQADCSLCTSTELIERIQREIPPLLNLAAKNQAVRAGAGDGGDGAGDAGDGGDGASEGGDDGTEELEPIGPLGFAGIGAAVLGLAGVGTGVGLVVKGTEVIDARPYEQRNFKPPGFASLAVGGVALVAGAVMIAVDVSKRKKARTRETAARVRWIGLGVSF